MLLEDLHQIMIRLESAMNVVGDTQGEVRDSVLSATTEVATSLMTKGYGNETVA